MYFFFFFFCKSEHCQPQLSFLVNLFIGFCFVLFFPQLMIHPDPTRRPSTSDLIKHPVLLTTARMSADQLRVELNAEKFKNALLQKYVLHRSLPSVYCLHSSVV